MVKFDYLLNLKIKKLIITITQKGNITMGLDIFLYTLTKPELDTSKTYTEEELRNQDLSFMAVEDNDREHIYPQDMIDNHTVIVDVKTRYTDTIAIFKEFQKKYPEIYSDINDYFRDVENRLRKVGDDDPYFDPQIVMQRTSSEGMEIKFVDYGPTYKDRDIDYSDLKNITIFIEADDKKAIDKITFTKDTPTYVVKEEEIDYQRKGLNERGWELLPENCTYCMDRTVIEQLVEEGNLSESFLENWVDGETALMAWW